MKINILPVSRVKIFIILPLKNIVPSKHREKLVSFFDVHLFLCFIDFCAFSNHVRSICFIINAYYNANTVARRRIQSVPSLANVFQRNEQDR